MLTNTVSVESDVEASLVLTRPRECPQPGNHDSVNILGIRLVQRFFCGFKELLYSVDHVHVHILRIFHVPQKSLRLTVREISLRR